MPTISLISTYHGERGLCNAEALYLILEALQPDVLFLEMPPGSLSRELNAQRSPESRAVSRYLAEHPSAKPLPVDIMEASGELIAENQRLCLEMHARSREYGHLIRSDAQYIQDHGFAYLNSKYCVETWLKVNAEIVETLDRIGNANLSSGYADWNAVNAEREREMMKKIRAYCEEHRFDAGVFLVGAAHRRAIMELARSIPVSDAAPIEWNFSGYDGVIQGWREDAAAS